MGVRQPATTGDAIATIRTRHGIASDAIVIAAFGGVADEKRIGPLLNAVSVARAYEPRIRVLLVGQALPHYDALSIARDLGLDEIVTGTGYVPDHEVGAYLAAADVVSCLRWPTARETSASWLRAIAAGRATIVTDLADQAGTPTLDPRSWTVLDATPGQTTRAPIAVSIDVLDEDHSLTLAVKRLTADRTLRERLGVDAEAYWRANHTIAHMAADYETLLAGLKPRRHEVPLPAHLRPDGLEHARALLAPFGDAVTSTARLNVASPNRHSRPVTRAPGWWATALIVAFGIVHTSLQIAATRPYLPPAGDGAFVIGDIIQSGVGAGRLLVARPPALDAGVGSTPPTVGEVLPGSPAARAGVHAGDTILQITNTATGRSATFSPRADVQSAIAAWRDAYWVGLSGPVVVSLRDREGRAKQARIAREPVWRLGPPMSGEWTATHLGPLIQLVTFVTCAAVLLALRPRDPAAQFSIAALVFAGVGATGPLAGGELALPNGARQIMTVLAWLSTALAFPTVALAISYFPRKAAILTHHRWLHAIPFVVAAPIAVTSGMTGAYLSGVNGLADAAAWDASHPMLFLWIFGVGLSVNIAAMVESVIRFRKNPDGQERRRVALSVWTLVIGTLAFTLRDGVPVLVAALGGTRFTWPAWIALPLYVLVALPAIGVTYAVAVHRVLSPRVAMRSSLQYALARKTLTAAAVLPAVLLVVSLVRKRDQSLSAIVAGQPLLYAGALAMFLVALRFRDRARAWLDRRFFRTDYDARSVLVSLAGRVPFETDPNELTALVLDEIDRSLKPSMAAVLVSGLEPGSLVPVAVLRGSADSLSEAGGIASMLQWSNEPLELYLDDTRSPARRLPPDEIAWLECTGAILFVPLYSKDSTTRTAAGGARAGRQAIGGAVFIRRPRAPLCHRGAGQPGAGRRTAAAPGHDGNRSTAR